MYLAKRDTSAQLYSPTERGAPSSVRNSQPEPGDYKQIITPSGRQTDIFFGIPTEKDLRIPPTRIDSTPWNQQSGENRRFRSKLQRYYRFLHLSAVIISAKYRCAQANHTQNCPNIVDTPPTNTGRNQTSAGHQIEFMAPLAQNTTRHTSPIRHPVANKNSSRACSNGVWQASRNTSKSSKVRALGTDWRLRFFQFHGGFFHD